MDGISWQAREKWQQLAICFIWHLLPGFSSWQRQTLLGREKHTNLSRHDSSLYLCSVKLAHVCSLLLSLFSLHRVHTVEILPKKIRSTFHSAAHALASLGAAASCYHMVSVNVSFLVIGIVVAVISIGTSLLTWTFPETKILSMGNALSRTISSDGAGAFAAGGDGITDDSSRSILAESSRTTSSTGKASISRV